MCVFLYFWNYINMDIWNFVFLYIKISDIIWRILHFFVPLPTSNYITN